MKSGISKLFLASAFAVTANLGAATITQYANNLQIIGAGEVTYSDFYAFNSYNTRGTLTGVTLYVDYSSISGSFTYTQGNTSPTNGSIVRGFAAYLTLLPGTQGSGSYNGLSEEVFTDLVDLDISAPTLPKEVPKNTSATFTLSNAQTLVSSFVSFDVSSGDYINYEGRYAPSFTLVGSFYTSVTRRGNPPGTSYVGATTLTNLRLVYDYTESLSVPEPSTYGLGLGVLALAAVAVRRRKVKA
jgi:hypothetical protein